MNMIRMGERIIIEIPEDGGLELGVVQLSDFEVRDGDRVFAIVNHEEWQFNCEDAEYYFGVELESFVHNFC